MSSTKKKYIDIEVDSLVIDEEVRKGMIAFVLGAIGEDDASYDWRTYRFRPNSALPQLVQVKFPDGKIISGNLDRNAFVEVGKPFSFFTTNRGSVKLRQVCRIVKRFRRKGKKRPPPFPLDA